MAAALNAADAALLATMAPDLRFILSDRDVPLPIQVQLAAAGYKTIGLFCSFVDSKAELRNALKKDFGLDPDEAGISNDVAKSRRVSIAQLVDSWDTTTKRQEESDRVQAEQKASRLPMTMSRSIHINMRQRYEADFGRVHDKCWPCLNLIEKRFEEIEEGEVRADTLCDVVSADADVQDIVGAVMDKDGAIRIKKTARSVPLPKDSEELRVRLKILGVTFQLAAYKHSSRLWLSTTSPGVWREHADYILGDDIYGFSVVALNQRVEPPWQVVLSYEFHVRKQACRLIMFEGMDFAAAMAKARRCTETKEKHFSTPVALSATRGGKRPQWGGAAWTNDASEGPEPKKGKGKGKAKAASKSKGKGKGAGGKKFPHTKTPDGRLICFNFQNGTCSAAECKFVHICARCLGPHAMSACTAGAA